MSSGDILFFLLANLLGGNRKSR